MLAHPASNLLMRKITYMVLDPVQTCGAGCMPWRNQEQEQPKEGPATTSTYLCHLTFISLRIFKGFEFTIVLPHPMIVLLAL